MKELSAQISAHVRDRIQQLRTQTLDEHQRPVSQRQFAKRIGVSHATIANVESGAQQASLQLIYAIAANLSVPLNELLPSVEDVADAVPQPTQNAIISKMLPEWGELVTAQ